MKGIKEQSRQTGLEWSNPRKIGDILKDTPHLPLPLPITDVESTDGAKSDSRGQGPSHWAAKNWGLPFPEYEQVEFGAQED